MTGRLAPPVKPLAPMPGCDASVSPSVGSVRNFRLFSLRTVTGCAVSVSLCSIAPPLTTTRSASAVPGDGDGVGLGVAVTASCAIAMLTPKSSAVAAVKTFFIDDCLEIEFQN
jgi:hypothetical protein